MKHLSNRLIDLVRVPGSRLQVTTLIVLLLTGLNVYAGEKWSEWVPSYTIEKRSIDKNLKAGTAELVFTCQMPNRYKLRKGSFTLNYNGHNNYLYTDTFGVAKHEIEAGRYKFYLFGYDYKEIPMDTITIASQEKIEISVRFESDNHPHPVRKPVIYLYPAFSTEINVELNIKGKLTFSYPAYNNGWNVTVQPDGTITHNDKKYNYLFWEADPLRILPEGSKNEGDIIGTDTLLSYLQNSLTAMGLNSKEQQDFITYWYPQMLNNETNLVRFVFNDDCNTYAEMNITPKPDNIYRVYMIWANAAGRDFPKLVKQTFPVLKREAFTVVEWGGIELKTTDLNFCGN